MKRQIFWLLVMLSPLAWAGTTTPPDALKTAQQALSAGDYHRAYALYAQHANTHPLAQFTLGLFHHLGWGRKVNPVEACSWFEKAANQNVPAAQQFLGDCFAGGIGRTVDGQAAVQWYQKAADNGISYALCAAGGLYIEGKVLNKDVRQGLARCTQAAQNNSPPAMLRLADYYHDGTLVPQDMVSARYWYQQAAERHIQIAQYRLGIMLREGEGGNLDTKTALFWLETAASEGYSPAYLPTAKLYAQTDIDPQTGTLTPEHLAKVYLWTSAAKARITNSAQLTEITQLEAQVLKVIPPSWLPDLNRMVAEHLAKFNRN